MFAILRRTGWVALFCVFSVGIANAQEPPKEAEPAIEEQTKTLEAIVKMLESSAEQWTSAAEKALESAQEKQGDWTETLKREMMERSVVWEAQQKELAARFQAEIAELQAKMSELQQRWSEKPNQPERPRQPEIVNRLITVNYNFARAKSIAQSFVSEASRVMLTSIDEKTSIIGISGPKELVDLVEEAIRTRDLPERNIELVLYITRGTSESSSATDVPKVLSPVITQLQEMFAYKAYTVLDTLVLRVRDGQGGSLSGVLPQIESTEDDSASYELRIQRAALTGLEANYTVRVDDLSFSVVIPYAVSTQLGDVPVRIHQRQSGVTIQTNVDIGDGQKVVVGKANVDGTNDALFVVMTASVLE